MTSGALKYFGQWSYVGLEPAYEILRVRVLGPEEDGRVWVVRASKPKGYKRAVHTDHLFDTPAACAHRAREAIRLKRDEELCAIDDAERAAFRAMEDGT